MHRFSVVEMSNEGNNWPCTEDVLLLSVHVPILTRGYENLHTEALANFNGVALTLLNSAGCMWHAAVVEYLMPVSHCPYGFYGQVTVETVG